MGWDREVGPLSAGRGKSEWEVGGGQKRLIREYGVLVSRIGCREHYTPHMSDTCICGVAVLSTFIQNQNSVCHKIHIGINNNLAFNLSSVSQGMQIHRDYDVQSS